MLEIVKDFSEVFLQRIYILKVEVRHGFPLGPFCFHRRANCSVGSAPTHNKQVAFFISINRGQRNVIRDALDFFSSQVDHFVVVLGFVIHVSRLVLFLQSADSVFESRCSRDCPFACKRRIVAQVGEIIIRVFPELWRNIRNVGNVRELPWLRAVSKVSIGQHDHRGHELQSNTRSFEDRIETIARC